MSINKSFKPGDVVCPTSTRCALAPGKYLVESFVPSPPSCGYYGIVFVEGHAYGITAEYLRLHKPEPPVERYHEFPPLTIKNRIRCLHFALQGRRDGGSKTQNVTVKAIDLEYVLDYLADLEQFKTRALDIFSRG